jgi:predicted protein tyrosine phosphatase
VRRYHKNDWWDLMVVIDQELEKSNTYKTYVNIADELKWRLVDSISEGANHKIKAKMKELKVRFHDTCEDLEQLSDVQKEEINAIFDFVLNQKKPVE